MKQEAETKLPKGETQTNSIVGEHLPSQAGEGKDWKTVAFTNSLNRL